MSVFYCIMVTFILFQSFSFFMETRNIPVLIIHLLNDIQNAFFIVSREKKMRLLKINITAIFLHQQNTIIFIKSVLIDSFL